MNERYLWSLWEKCTHPHPKHGGGNMVFPMEFAELIIQECVQSIEKTIETKCDTGSEKLGCEFAITDLLEHFGIE